MNEEKSTISIEESDGCPGICSSGLEAYFSSKNGRHFYIDIRFTYDQGEEALIRELAGGRDIVIEEDTVPTGGHTREDLMKLLQEIDWNTLEFY